MDPEEGRCLVWRKCATCGEKTDHAWLRDDLEHYADGERDFVEREQHETIRAWSVVEETQDALEACGIDVRWPESMTWRDEDVALLMQRLNDGSHVLYLNRHEEDPLRVLGAMEAAWLELALGDQSRPLWRTRAGNGEGLQPYRWRMLSAPRT